MKSSAADVPVVEALGHELEDLELAVGEPGAGNLRALVRRLTIAANSVSSFDAIEGEISDWPAGRHGPRRRPLRSRSPSGGSRRRQP